MVKIEGMRQSADRLFPDAEPEFVWGGDRLHGLIAFVARVRAFYGDDVLVRVAETTTLGSDREEYLFLSAVASPEEEDENKPATIDPYWENLEKRVADLELRLIETNDSVRRLCELVVELNKRKGSGDGGSVLTA